MRFALKKSSSKKQQICEPLSFPFGFESFRRKAPSTKMGLVRVKLHPWINLHQCPSLVWNSSGVVKLPSNTLHPPIPSLVFASPQPLSARVFPCSPSVPGSWYSALSCCMNHYSMWPLLDVQVRYKGIWCVIRSRHSWRDSFFFFSQRASILRTRVAWWVPLPSLPDRDILKSTESSQNTCTFVYMYSDSSMTTVDFSYKMDW